MEKIFMLFLLFSFLFLSCGKKDSTESDVKKDQTKTETKQETQSDVSKSDPWALPADFPLSNPIFKDAVQSKAKSEDLMSVTFKSEKLPADIVSIVDKELTEKGFKKTKDTKNGANSEITWENGTKKVGLNTAIMDGKCAFASVNYNQAK